MSCMCAHGYVYNTVEPKYITSEKPYFITCVIPMRNLGNNGLQGLRQCFSLGTENREVGSCLDRFYIPAICISYTVRSACIV